MRSFLAMALVLSALFCLQPAMAKPHAGKAAAPAEQTQTAQPVDSEQPEFNSEKSESNSEKPELNSEKPSGDNYPHSPGTVRVNNLANLEALLNIIANGVEILGLACGMPACLLVPVGIVLLVFKGKRIWGWAMILTGPIVVIVALAVPGVINWLVSSARDAALFN